MKLSLAETRFLSVHVNLLGFLHYKCQMGCPVVVQTKRIVQLAPHTIIYTYMY